jgi:hypothetical protein
MTGVHQAYNKYVTRSDKAFFCDYLSLFCKAKSLHKGVVTQWNLIHIVLTTIRETKPERWTSSFDACNLDPQTQTSFVEWCKKIESHLQLEDLFLLLPAFWHGMFPDERQYFIDSINKEGFSPAVLQKLQTEFKIEPKDWMNVLTCYNVCKNKPEYLGRKAPSRPKEPGRYH